MSTLPFALVNVPPTAVDGLSYVSLPWNLQIPANPHHPGAQTVLGACQSNSAQVGLEMGSFRHSPGLLNQVLRCFMSSYCLQRCDC